jgi:hypothetical protein
MTSIITQKYALLVAFEYSNLNGQTCDKPSQLISIDADLMNMWHLCTDTFKIKRNNITVITDLRVNPKRINPWDVMDSHRDGNPCVVRMEFPSVDNLIGEMIQFVENSIRDIQPIKSDETIKREVFVYFSGHGAFIQHPVKKKQCNGLILLDSECRKRVYMPDTEIFRILFGQLEVKDDEDESKGGYMTVPIVKRDIVVNEKKETSVSFTEDLVTVNINPSPSKHNRGLPYETSMLMVIDSCHSGTMADLPYMYSPGNRLKGIRPQMTKLESEIVTGPYIVCVGATNDVEVAPSVDGGSPFTTNFVTRVKQCREPFTIHKFQQMLEYELPRVLIGCSPTITSTSNRVTSIIPFIGL